MRPQKYTPPEDPYYDLGDDKEPHEDGYEEKELGSTGKGDAAHEGGTDQVTASVHKPRRGYDPQGRRTIEVEVTTEQWDKYMALQPGEKVVVRIEKRGRDGDWERLKTRHMFQWPAARSTQLLRR